MPMFCVIAALEGGAMRVAAVSCGGRQQMCARISRTGRMTDEATAVCSPPISTALKRRCMTVLYLSSQHLSGSLQQSMSSCISLRREVSRGRARLYSRHTSTFAKIPWRSIMEVRAGSSRTSTHMTARAWRLLAALPACMMAPMSSASKPSWSMSRREEARCATRSISANACRTRRDEQPKQHRDSATSSLGNQPRIASCGCCASFSRPLASVEEELRKRVRWWRTAARSWTALLILWKASLASLQYTSAAVCMWR
mmetsp:Transcript_63025/g.101945  ORF Transcript_63025/g.101945 Transcript_63025/m.101945 type:complete len:256 (+) Transcript_63025:40-807(+)